MASTATSPHHASSLTQHASPQQRRLQAEWALLQQMIAANPQRLTHARAADTTFHVTLLATPALPLEPHALPLSTHALRVVYPAFFPTVPLELYLDHAVLHPNIHPQTGFVCLWNEHRVSNGIEHALHKMAAILGWQLMNLDPRHVMQSLPQATSPDDRQRIASSLQAEPLQGIAHPAPYFLTTQEKPRRPRLS